MINKRGFTLVELIMAIVVVGIISIPISLSLGQHIRSAAVSEENSTAINLGRFEMELVNNLAYASINSVTSANYQGYPYDVVRTVSYAQGSGATPESLKKIAVDVKKSGSADILVSLVTYIAANVLYGI
jgi:prepilin-type N-terminal cleavage/methylation domain-containing protein